MPGRSERRNHTVERAHIIGETVQQDDRETLPAAVVFVSDVERARLHDRREPARRLRAKLQGAQCGPLQKRSSIVSHETSGRVSILQKPS